jgi:hypothetical protein
LAIIPSRQVPNGFLLGTKGQIRRVRATEKQIEQGEYALAKEKQSNQPTGRDIANPQQYSARKGVNAD